MIIWSQTNRRMDILRFMKKILLGVTFCLLNICYSLNIYATSSESPQWTRTLKSVSQSIVSIRVNTVRTFDTEQSMVSQATGFVVDAKKGIILTNRHVVNPGPVTAEAVFSNGEEIELKPVYRDPVHDFGFFKYNPEQLKFIQPHSLKLIENTARIGDDIRVIGNDSGEHMSILSGTLARLDRSAPKYRRGSYNDFNTFYYQSSADTSGGSSGSPVINRNGEVIALNAGGHNKSSSSFFLPLYKITRTLKAIQQGIPVARGTIQITLNYKPYDEVKRLGLTPQLEKLFRAKNHGKGLLVVEKTVKEGPADNKLRPGDIIISLSSNNKKIDHLSRYEIFEIFLDNHVNQEITIDILRRGKQMSLNMTVENLHDISPDEYIEMGGGILNNFSYQLARQTNLPASGVFVASSGYMLANAGVGRGAIIQSINNQPINNLKDIQEALSPVRQNEHFVLKYIHISAPSKQRIANVRLKTSWHQSRHCKRMDYPESWRCKKLNWKSKLHSTKPTDIQFTQYNDRYVAKVAKSLVMVEASLPYHIDGQNYNNYTGTGVVIDAKAGLVIADRNTVPVKMADVFITVAGVTEIPAEVLFVHPVHSYTLLRYDTSLLKGDTLKSASLLNKPLKAGESIWLVGYQTNNRLISEKLNVSSNEPLTLPDPQIPQFKESNTNGIKINNPPLVASGALIDKRGKIRAWWTNFEFTRNSNETIDRGLPVNHIINIRDQWRKKGQIDVYSLEMELQPMNIARARNFGLSDEWMAELQDTDNHAQALKISKRVAGSDASEKLLDGDILLAIDDRVIRNYNDLERAINKPAVKLTLWRNKKQKNIRIKTRKLTNTDTNEFLIWSGALLQKPHRAVSIQKNIPATGVYISWYWYGSPANRHGLIPLRRITEFEGEIITDLAQFLQLSKKFKDKKYVQVRLLDLNGAESLITIKQDHHYWPTQRVSWKNNQWVNSLVN